MPNPEEIKKRLFQIREHLKNLETAYNSAPDAVKRAANDLGFKTVIENEQAICSALDSPGFFDKIESDPEEYYRGIVKIQQGLYGITPYIIDGHYAFKRFSEGYSTVAITSATGPEYIEDKELFNNFLRVLVPLNESVPQLTKDVTELALDVEKKLPENDERKISWIRNYENKSRVQRLQEQMAENEIQLKRIRDKYDMNSLTRQIDYKNLNLKEQFDSQLEQLKNVKSRLEGCLNQFSTYQGRTDEQPLDSQTKNQVMGDFTGFISAIESANDIPDTDVKELNKARVNILNAGNKFFNHFDQLTDSIAKIVNDPFDNNKVDEDGLEDRTVAEVFFKEICDDQLLRIGNMINNLEILASGVIAEKLGEEFDMQPKDFDHDEYELADEKEKLFYYHRECTHKLNEIEAKEPEVKNPEQGQPDNDDPPQEDINNVQPENFVVNEQENVQPIIQQNNDQGEEQAEINPDEPENIREDNPEQGQPVNNNPPREEVNVVQPESIVIEQPENNPAENRIENVQQKEPAIDPAEAELADFKKLADELEAAKTTFNSKEYGKLITYVRALSNRELMERARDNEKKRLLAATGKAVNNYLTHKAKDGVKPNVFKKFVAVENVSKYLDRKLNPYKDETIDIGKGEMVSVNDLCLSYGSRSNKANQQTPEALNLAINIYNAYSRRSQVYFNSTTTEAVRDASTCLKKVLLETCQLDPKKATKMDDVIKKFTSNEFAHSELEKDAKVEKDTQAPQI